MNLLDSKNDNGHAGLIAASKLCNCKYTYYMKLTNCDRQIINSTRVAWGKGLGLRPDTDKIEETKYVGGALGFVYPNLKRPKSNLALVRPLPDETRAHRSVTSPSLVLFQLLGAKFQVRVQKTYHESLTTHWNLSMDWATVGLLVLVVALAKKGRAWS